jgi:hypothetical protein
MRDLIDHSAVSASLLLTSILLTVAPTWADDAIEVGRRIDQLVAERWASEGVTPTTRADDAEFMRRVYLDLAGKIPPVMEVREFLADESTDKRSKLVDRLLNGPNYVTHSSSLWVTTLLPEANSNLQLQFIKPAFESWLRGRIEQGTPYDELVRELLTASLTNQQNPTAQFASSSPAAFYLVKQGKPENLAAATARTFLGVRIECAQCHHHPFDSWKQEQFWGFAAFFSSVVNPSPQAAFAPLRENNSKRDIKIPDSDQVVQASFLTGEQPAWKKQSSPRQTLAEWVTAKENPYFARAAVNRIWGQMFGVGIVDPVDDFSAHNPPSHPKLLDELASEFAEHDFGLEFLLRAITSSQTYQLSSARTHESQDDPRLFARMNLKGLTSSQLFNSLAQATGYQEPALQRFQGQFVINGQSNPKSELLEVFQGDSPSLLDRQTTIIQALAMMNGRFTGDASSVSKSQTLSAVVEYPGLETNQKIETLYLATLSRKPRDDEMERLAKFVADREASKNEREALGDVFWALLNSSEFFFNH